MITLIAMTNNDNINTNNSSYDNSNNDINL